jgi:copper(I)-binding protein
VTPLPTRSGRLVLAAVAAGVLMAGCGTSNALLSGDAGSPSPSGPAVSVSDAWVVLPAAPDVTAAFATVRNDGPEEVRLVGVDSDVAGVTQVHETITEGTVERMQEVSNGIPVPAGQTVQLQPGGYHVMLMRLTRSLAVGDAVDLSFRFSDGSTVVTTAPVRARDGMTGAGSMASMRPSPDASGSGMPGATTSLSSSG